MTTVGSALRRDAGDPSETSARRPTRRIGTRSPFPHGRAIVGGLLVACSAVGLLAAHRAATEPHLTQWIVARRDIHLGHRITADDLGLARMDLLASTGRRAFANPDGVIGRTARAPISEGELVQRSAIAGGRDVNGAGRRLSLQLPAAQALDGVLSEGDRVDVLGTTDDANSTEVIGRDAMVVAVSGRDESLGASDDIRLTLVVADETTAQSVIDATVHGKVTVITHSGDVEPSGDGS